MGIPGAEEVAGNEWSVRTCAGDVGVGSSAIGVTTGRDSTAMGIPLAASTNGDSTAEVACATAVRVLEGTGAEGARQCRGDEVLLWATERRRKWLTFTLAGSDDCAGSGIQSRRPLPCTDRGRWTLLLCLICPTWLGGGLVGSEGTPAHRWIGGIEAWSGP